MIIEIAAAFLGGKVCLRRRVLSSSFIFSNSAVPKDRGGDLVVSVLNFYSNDLSYNPTGYV